MSVRSTLWLMAVVCVTHGVDSVASNGVQFGADTFEAGGNCGDCGRNPLAGRWRMMMMRQRDATCVHALSVS